MYTREIHETLCRTMFRKRTALEIAEKVSELIHLGLVLTIFPVGVIILGIMVSDKLVDISVAFAVITMFSRIFAESFFGKLEGKGPSVEISELRNVLEQFLSENEVKYLLGTEQLSGKIPLKALEIFNIYNEFRYEVQENVPEDMEDEIFFERMQKYYKELPEIIENEKEYEIDEEKKDLLYNRKRLVKSIRALKRYRRIEERMKEKRNIHKLLKKAKNKTASSEKTEHIAIAPPTRISWKRKDVQEQKN